MQVSYSYICLHIGLLISLLTFSANAEQCNPEDKKVLLLIKAQLNITGFDEGLDMWNSNNSKCCTEWSGVKCNAKGRVNSLDIALTLFTSSSVIIPPAIGYLPYLESLSIDASFGFLSGLIPVSFTKLTQLQSLVLAGQGISGPLPDFLGRLTKLTYLNLGSNKFNGSIPASLGQLTKLTYLNLLGNSLSGSIPASLGQLTELTSLELGSNHLSGSIPASLGRLTNLKYLGLTQNRLSGPIPESLSQLKKVESFLLGQNRLSGPIPASLASLPKVGQIDLSLNQLTGSIPASFLSINNPNLFLSLSQNRLSALIPKSLGRASFNILDFSGNMLSGPIPSSLGRATVGYLDLSNNKLSGDASFLFGKDKTTLDAVILNNNNLHFDFSNVAFPVGLRDLNIASNKIYGSLPKQLGQLSFRTFNVSNNQLCGVIPTGRRLKRLSPDLFANNKCLCGVPLPPCK